MFIIKLQSLPRNTRLIFRFYSILTRFEARMELKLKLILKRMKLEMELRNIMPV